MKKTLPLTLAAALALAACSTPVTTGASPDSITLRYDPALYSRDEMQAKAAEHCRQQGRRDARFVSSSKDAPLGFRYDVFACDA